MNTIKIHEDKSFDFDIVKNQSETNEDKILDSYIYDDDFESLTRIPKKEPEEEPVKQLVKIIDTPEVRAKKIEVKGLIKRYTSSVFGTYLTEYETLDYDNMSLAKLEETLAEIEHTVDCHESNAFGRETFGVLLGVGETVLQKSGILCKGLAKKLIEDEKAMRLVDRISLKRRLSMSPEYQLGLVVLSNAYILHKMNESVDVHVRASRKVASSEVVDEYNDLDTIVT